MADSTHPEDDTAETQIPVADESVQVSSSEEVPPLPVDVQKRIDAGEAPDPIWYVGRVGPSAQDVLHASPEELQHFRDLAGPAPDASSNGNGGASRRSRGPATD